MTFFNFVDIVLLMFFIGSSIAMYLDVLRLRSDKAELEDEVTQLKYNLMQFKIKHGYSTNED